MDTSNSLLQFYHKVGQQLSGYCEMNYDVD